MTKKLLLAELDARLTEAAQTPDTYDRVMGEYAVQCDCKELDLELLDPIQWRRSADRVTLSRSNSLEQLFRADVAAILPLDKEEETALARRIEFARVRLESALERAGVDFEELSPDNVDVESIPLPSEALTRWREWHALRKEMVERNLFLVLLNLERYAHTRASRMDLIQEGASALFRAADGFDWRRGLLFRTYAVHWLHQAFRSHLYNFGHTVRLPVYLQKAMKHVNDAANRLGTDDPEKIAKETGLGENLVSNAQSARRGMVSVDTGFTDSEGEGKFADVLAEDEDLETRDLYRPDMEDVSLGDGLRMALGRLEERERKVIEKRFGLFGEREHTLSELSESLQVSLERVRQIQIRALQKMNAPAVRRAVDPFLL
ncbi:MAG: sigma-70 family RNA polymerase sigma factor [Planctomycetes bacterium]|nr:sigma-70 family RNA polymerase sigma factor [Planctomycetota bacterium]